MLEKYFNFKAHRTNMKTEIVAGLRLLVVTHARLGTNKRVKSCGVAKYCLKRL